MKKRLVTLAVLTALTAGLCFGALPLSGRADSSGLCFLAVNDNLLELSAAPAFVGGITYIPASALSAYSIYTTAFSDNSTVSVYNGAAQLYFDMSAGGCYDGAGNEYSVSAVYRGGAVYVPAVFVCNFFGVGCTYIRGTGYGDIVRLNNGSAVLTDSGFLDAATNLMQFRYNSYFGISQGGSAATPTPRATPTPSPSPSPSPNRSGTSVYLSIEGMPGEDLLDILDMYGVRACFFLSPQDILGAPDMLLRLTARGQRVGALCGDDPEADYAEVSALIYEICRMQTLFVASSEAPEDCRDMAEKSGLIFWHYDIGGGDGGAAEITSLIAARNERADLRLDADGGAGELMPVILSYLKSNKFDVRVFSEAETPFDGVEAGGR